MDTRNIDEERGHRGGVLVKIPTDNEVRALRLYGGEEMEENAVGWGSFLEEIPYREVYRGKMHLPNAGQADRDGDCPCRGCDQREAAHI